MPDEPVYDRFNQLLTELPARVEVELHPRATDLLAGPALARQRAVVRRTVAGCTSCGLVERCSAPVPYSAPVSQPVFTIIGEGPGPKEDQLARPFVGPSGRFLRGMLTGTGLHPDDVLYANVVSCYPHTGEWDGKGTSKGAKPRAPTNDEMLACRDNLLDQLAIGPRFVLLCGAVALSAFRGDLKISEVHGRVMVWDSTYVVMPIFHPAAILRARELKVPTMADLARWKMIVTGEVGVLDALGWECVRCGETMDHYDPDGIPYCQRHWPKYGGSWIKERKKWVKKVPMSTSVSMFTVDESS